MTILEERKQEFEAAKRHVEPSVADRVMLGLPVEHPFAPRVLAFHHAWAKYHNALQYGIA